MNQVNKSYEPNQINESYEPKKRELWAKQTRVMSQINDTIGDAIIHDNLLLVLRIKNWPSLLL